MWSKARESTKAMTLASVLLDFQHVCVRRRSNCTRLSVDMQQFRKVSRTRAMHSVETHTSDFIFNTFEMGSQCSFPRRGVEWWWRGAKRTSLAAKF